MKIKSIISVTLLFCLAFALCACTNTENTGETTTAPAATTTVADTEATTTAPAKTKAEIETTASAAEFTEDDALELVKNTYDFSDEYFFVPNGTVEIDGTSYYAINLRKSLENNTTYISSYFVTLDGSNIYEGFIAGDVAEISDSKPTIDVTEDNAVKVIEAAYDFEENCFLTYRGVEEIDGVSYFAVDLRKSLETNTTYLSTYFVTETGTIVEGYYEGNTPVLAE
ncbi:MAG: hypothetical protein IJF52_01225 [Clostridia bacterium]|nr:hypothetical protein [Clostridia bacterium]